MAEPVADVRARTGLDIVGVYAFGDTPELQDELLDFVRRGTKRATAGAVPDLEQDTDPFPEAGQYWGLLDGRGQAQFVVETVEVTRGPMGGVTAAFAWDEGEYDRTLESWLNGHRSFFTRMGYDDPDDLEVTFERFRVVWPVPDETVWLTADVRELRWDERDWLREVYAQHRGTVRVVARGQAYDVGTLPALVWERDGERLGVLAFRPRPGGETECVTVEVFGGSAGVEAALDAGITELARRSGWSRVWSAPGGE